MQDAEQDAAVELIGYRNTFDLARCAHMPRPHQENLLVYWTRLRLTAMYDARIAEAVMTQTCGEESDYGSALAQSEPTPALDALGLEKLIATFPPRARAILKGVFYEGKEQRQIARELGLSQTVISREYAKAKELVREALLCGS